jgi:hypothetical protein
MKRKTPDLIEQWIRRGVLLAAEMRKHGVVMKFHLAWEPAPKKSPKKIEGK